MTENETDETTNDDADDEAPTGPPPPVVPEASLFRTVGVGAAWLLGTAVAVRLGELLVGRSPLGATLVGAVIVDLATYRVGVRWDAHEDGLVATRARLQKGLLLGLFVSVLLVSFSLCVSVAVLGASLSLGSPTLSLLLGLLRAAAVGARDELLFRGLPLVVAKRAGIPLPWAVGFAALLGAASLLYMPGTSWQALVLMASQGVLYGILWTRTGAAYAPVVAHAGWAFLSGIGLRGGFLEVTWGSGALAEGTQAKGAAALGAAVVALGMAALVWRSGAVKRWGLT